MVAKMASVGAFCVLLLAVDVISSLETNIIISKGYVNKLCTDRCTSQLTNAQVTEKYQFSFQFISLQFQFSPIPNRGKQEFEMNENVENFEFLGRNWRLPQRLSILRLRRIIRFDQFGRFQPNGIPPTLLGQ